VYESDAKYLLEKTKLFGIKKMRLANRHFGKVFIFFIYLNFIPGIKSELWAKAPCDDLHQGIFVSAKEVPQRLIQSAEARAVAGELCAQNIIGRMYAEGKGVSPDWERSYAIFSKLSNKDYPPAHLNLAIHIAEKPDLDLDSYLPFLVGLIAKYGSSPQHADIARGAKEIGFYVLRKKLNESSFEVEKFEKLRASLQEFEFKAGEAMVSSAIEIVNKRREAKQRDDTIVGIIALGTAVYTARTSSAPAYSASGSLVTAPAWSRHSGIVGPTSLYRAPAWRAYSGIVGPDILYRMR
jgi:hypothetical protein